MGYKFIPKQLLGSVYNIDELKNNFNDVKIGDEVNYEINGYSDWQVIGKDDYNGTIDVVSKTNTEDLTLEPNQSKEYYEQKFQETANKYIDNNYAISARTVNSSDLDYFDYDNDFWLNNITEDTITTSKDSWKFNTINYKIYAIPYMLVPKPENRYYNAGEIIEYKHSDKLDINRWVIVGNEETMIYIIPETPIEIPIKNINDDISKKYYELTEEFHYNVGAQGNYFNSFSPDNLPNLIPNFLSQQNDKIWFYVDGLCPRIEENSLNSGWCNSILYYQNGGFYGNSNQTIYTDANSKSLGYRSVVTLKIKEEKQDKDKKEISSKLQVGDNVKYEAKGYKNWKVLSIDEDNNTVDIISGGIVKNLTLSGKEDWDNYEDIIQREVDEYKNGENAKKATTITSNDLKTLKEIDKNILSRYWILSKNTMIKNSVYYNSKTADLIYYYIGVINLYKNDNFDKYISNIAIYADYKGDQETVEYYNNDGYYTNEINQSSYTAGLRPVITLKLDSVEKLSDKETKKIEESTEKQEKKYIQEQETKNKNYKGPKTVDDTSSKGTKKDNNIKDINKSDEDNIKSNNDNVNKNNNDGVYATNDLKGISKGLFWYIIISVSLLNIISIILLVLVSYLVRKRTL